MGGKMSDLEFHIALKAKPHFILYKRRTEEWEHGD